MTRAQKYRAAHPERVKAAKAKYRAAHPEKMKADNDALAAKRRALRAAGLENNGPACAEWYAKNRASELAKRGGKRWGISPEEYTARLARPCEICGHVDKRVKAMHVDHDHETNKLRGTLCHDCNTGLGLFDDSTPRLLSAVQYLARYA